MEESDLSFRSKVTQDRFQKSLINWNSSLGNQNFVPSAGVLGHITRVTPQTYKIHLRGNTTSKACLTCIQKVYRNPYMSESYEL